MRDSNHCFAASNRASVVITSSLYDRRALDTTSALPLLNSLTHLTYLTSTSPRIREILTLDGGLERLLHILRNSSIPRPPPPAPDLYGLSIAPAIPASTGLLSADRAIAYRFSLAFQCVSNVGVRGSEQIRTRVVQAGVLDVVAQVLEVWLRSRGLSTEAGSTGQPGQSGSSSSRRDHSSRRRAVAAASASDARAAAEAGPPTTAAVSAPPPSPAAIIPPPQTTPRQAPIQRPVPQPASATIHEPVSAVASSSSGINTILARSADSGIGSVPTSGDEEAEMNDEDAGTGNDEDEMDVDPRSGASRSIAASDQETGRLANMASSALQAMIDGRPSPLAAIGADQTMSDPTPRAPDSHLPIAIPPRHRPAPTPGSSVGSTTSIDMAAPVASSSTSRLNPSVLSRTRPSLHQVDSSGHASGTSSPGASNVSTPMGTPTGGNVRERSGTLLARPPAHLVAARRRNRRDRAASGNESGTTGGEDDETVDGQGGGDEGDEERAPAQQNEMSPSVGVEIGIVEDEDSATEIDGHLDQLEGNVDLQMGAPPGAPGAVTPRTGADATPRQAFLPLTATGGTPAGLGVGATPAMGAQADPPTGAGPTPPTVRVQGGLFPPNTLMAAPPAIVALATAQATQRTLRDLSLEGNVQTPSETTYRDDDILLSLQLLAYLSKYPHVRQAFHRPREPFHPTLDLRVRPGDPPLPMRAPLSTTPNIFSLVERFTFRPSPTDPTIPQLPEEIVYWAGVIMRNACRKDESRGGIRQCANMTCGKWESLPRQFAKCRRCRKAKYCSKDCQSKAWSEGHRFWCSQRGEGEGSHAESQSSVQSGVPPVAVVAPTAEGDVPPPPPHHHHHHHHHPPGAPHPPNAIDQAIRRQVQDAFANQPGPVLRPPSPVRPPRAVYNPRRETSQIPVGLIARPVAADAMDVDMDEPRPATHPPSAGPSRAPAPSPSFMAVPAAAEAGRRTWSWNTLAHLGSPNETTNANLYAAPTVAHSIVRPSSSSRRSPSNSPQNQTTSLPSSSQQQDPPQPTRSSFIAPGALARAFNFAVPRLNTGGQERAGSSSAAPGPSSGGSGSSTGEERTRRGFFRGLSGGSSGERDRDESRSSSRGGGGDMDI